MKKLLLAVAVVLTISSCSKEDENPDYGQYFYFKLSWPNDSMVTYGYPQSELQYRQPSIRVTEWPAPDNSTWIYLYPALTTGGGMWGDPSIHASKVSPGELGLYTGNVWMISDAKRIIFQREDDGSIRIDSIGTHPKYGRYAIGRLQFKGVIHIIGKATSPEILTFNGTFRAMVLPPVR
jgi:hypothetical protein